MPEHGGSPTIRWTVGSGAERRKRFLWRAVPASRDDAFSDVACTQLSDDTPVAVTGGSDGVLRVWDLLDGRLRREAPIGDNDSVHALACARLADGTAGRGDRRRNGHDPVLGRGDRSPRDRTILVACRR